MIMKIFEKTLTICWFFHDNFTILVVEIDADKRTK